MGMDRRCHRSYRGSCGRILIKLSIDNKNANSYDYQINKAQKEAFSKNYDAAIDYYTNAITLQPKDIPARMAMVDIYMDREDYDSAIVLLSEVIDIDAGYKEAYQDLLPSMRSGKTTQVSLHWRMELPIRIS